MKIVTWNCNLNFTQKYDALKDYDADVMVIQECEQAFTVPGYNVFWTGTNIKRSCALVKSEAGCTHNTTNS